MLKTINWFVALLLLLVSGQIQAATWTETVGSKTFEYDDTASPATCSLTDNTANISLQEEMGDVTSLTYTNTLDCSKTEQYIVVKNNSNDYWQVHVLNGAFQAKQQLWIKTSASNHTIEWSKGSATREFTYNPPGANPGDPQIQNNCPTFDGVGIAAQQTNKINDLSFSSSVSCNQGDQHLLLKFDDKTYWRVQIESNEINSNLQACDKSYSFTYESSVITVENGDSVTVTAGCAPPPPTLTSFPSIIASGDEDNSGMSITYADLLANSDASLGKTSLGSDIGSTLYFKVEAVMSSGTLLIGGSDFSDSNKTIGPGSVISYKPSEHTNGTIDALQLSLDTDLGHTNSNSVTAKVSLNPVNDAPRKLTSGSMYVGSLLSSEISQSTLRAVDDIDVAIGSEVTDDIIFKLVSTPNRGSLLKSGSPLASNSTFTQTDVNDGKISYKNSSSGSSDSISLVVQDSSGLSNNVTFTISITIIQADRGSPIIAQGPSIGVIMSENSSPNPFSVSLNATNTAGGDSLMIWRLKTPPANGQAEVFGLGRSPTDEAREFVRYEPNENFDGTDSFTVLVNNGTQNESTIVINVTVEDVNAPPVITQGTSYGVNMSEDSSPIAFTASISATDRDDNDTSLFWDVYFHPLHGTVTLNGTTGSSPVINYTPTANYYGSDSFGLIVSDGTDTDIIRVPIYITPQNDAPTVNEGSSITVDMSEDGAPNPFNLTLNATDIESDDISWSITTQPSNGTLSLNGIDNSREITYVPQSNFVGQDTFVITVSDPNGGSNSTTVIVNVEPLNDAPSITQGDTVTVSMTEEGATPFSLTLDATDIDGDTLQWSILSAPNQGTASVASTSGLSTDINYSPDTDYFGADSFVVQVSDGTLSETIVVNVNVANINDPPVIQEGDIISKTVLEDTALAINLTALDSDSSVTWQILQQPGNGSVEFLAGFNSPKRVQYTPATNFNGPDSFQVAVSDGEFTDQITVNVTVATSNDAPSFREGLQTNIYISEDSFPTAFKLTLNGIDNEGDELSWSIDTAPTNGTAKIIVPLGTGRAIDYVPNANYHGMDSFIVKISDGSLSNTFKVNVTVEPNDDAPAVQSPLADLTFPLGETATQLSVSNVFTDVDSDDTAITKSIFLNDNESLVAVSVAGDLLTLNYVSGSVGTANISLLGVSGDKSVQDHFSVTIEDLIAPVFTNLPLDELTYEATGSQTSINPAIPAATDATSVVVDSNKPDQLALGTHTISWVATDSSGNTATTSQLIHIVDTTPPQLSLDNPTVTASAINGTSGNSVDLGEVLATDLVDGAVVTTASVPLTGSSVATLDIGQHTIIWQATDASGNTATQEQLVNVVDDTPPEIAFVNPTLTVSANHPTTNSVDLGAVTANDLVDGALIATTNTSLNGTVATLPIGQHTITWQATDTAGNTATKEQIVNVVDTTPPQITLASPVITVSANTQNSNNVDLGQVTANDLIDGNLTAIATNTLLSGTVATLPIGQHTVIWQATDTAGNAATQEQVVNVVDNTPPEIVLESPVITVNAGTQNNNSVDLGIVTANDLIDGSLQATTSTPLSGNAATLSIGQHTIIWQATDASGNMATQEQIVNVVDTGFPLIFIEVPSITVSATSQSNNNVDLGAVTASDLIDGSLTATTSTPLNGTVAVLPMGQHIITWQVTDTSGNTTTQQQIVNVVDNTPPQITLEQPFITVSANHPDSNSIDLGIVTATDLVDGALAPTTNTLLNGTVATLPIGQHTIIWQATDTSNNQITTEQVVNVVDTTPPQITLENTTLTVSASSQNNNSVELGAVEANDVIDGALTVTANIPLNGTLATLAVGQHVITWQATDASGNTATQEQTVNVFDSTLPEITLTKAVITVSASSQDNNNVDLGSVIANDLVDGALVATTTIPLNGTIATLSVGQHTIVWQVTDASGNTATQEQIVNVVDTTPPQITLENSVITVNAESQDNTVDLGTVTASDLVDGSLVASTTTPLNGTVATLAIGQHTIVWQATDSSGNTATQEQIINVVDTTKPQITFSNTVLTVSAINASNNSVDLGTISASDAVDGALNATPDISLNGSVATLSVGQHTITWQATDASGNTAIQKQTVNVVDTTKPQITLSNPVIRVDGTHPDNNSIDLGTVTATDQVDGLLSATTETPLNGTVATLPIGQHVIFWQATDANGNTATKEQIVNVVDNIQIVNNDDTTPPQIILGNPVITFNATSRDNNSVDLGSVIANDLVDGILTATTSTPLLGTAATLAIGQHTIVWQATDTSGNTATQEQTINVVDIAPPQITFENATITVIATSKENNSVELGSVSASDLIDGTLTVTTSTPLNGTTASLPIGLHTITWQATDISGNTATQEQIVSVIDTKPPQITLSQSVITAAATSRDNNKVDLGTVTVNDLIDGILTATTITPLDGTVATLSVGQHTVVWEAIDASGNRVRTAQVVNVVDTTPPQITLESPTITVNADERNNTVDLGNVIADDLVDGSVTVTANVPLNGTTATLAVGQHTVVWQATDTSGNTATQEQLINVIDNASPQITLSNATITFSASSKDSNVVNLGSVTATDSVDGAVTVTTTTPVNGTMATLPIGQHIIVWQAVDANGNTTTKEQIVNVVDDTPPQISLENSIITVNASSPDENQVDLGTVTANDLVDGTLAATTSTPLNGTIATLAVGQHTVVWQATDTSGNTSTQTQTVNVVGSESPVITVNDVIVEATGKTTTITEEILANSVSANDATDGEIDAIPQISLNGALPIGTHTIIWQATDSDGNQSAASQLVTIKDTTPPELVIENLQVTLNATGELTTINTSDLGISAGDLVDDDVSIIGEINGDALSSDLFESGIYSISWFAQDDYGNRSNAQEQTVRIVPLVNYGPTQLVSAGDRVSVRLILTGIAPDYPVSISYEIDTDASEGVSDIDHTATSGTLTLEYPETEGTFTFDISAFPVLNGLGEGKLVFGLGDLSGAIKGHNEIHTVDIKNESIPAIAEGQALLQGGEQVSAFIPDGGLATIIMSDPTGELIFSWVVANGLTDLDSNPDTYTFDPSAISVGSYIAEVSTTDSNGQIVNHSLYFNIADTSLDNVIDNNGNGIPDVKDINSSTNLLPISVNGGANLFLLSEAGTKVKLGSFATIRGDYNAIVQPGENGLPAISSIYTSLLHTYNYLVSSIAIGASIEVIIPHSQPIPEGAIYLVFNKDSNTWLPFEENSQNVIASAPYDGNSTICPPLGDSRYVSGLIAGNSCVSLTVVDGGSNDSDGANNGTISNVGVVASTIASTNTGTNNNGSGSNNVQSGGGGGGSIPLDILVLLVSILLFKRYIKSLSLRVARTKS